MFRKKGDQEVGTSDEERRVETYQPTARKVWDHLEIESLYRPKVRRIGSCFPSNVVEYVRTFMLKNRKKKIVLVRNSKGWYFQNLLGFATIL